MPRSSIPALLVLHAMLTLATAADAQIARRPVVRRPPNWAGVNVGIAQGYTIEDGTTSATWRFGSGLEYAVRFEHPMASGISLGVQGAYARMPLTYSSAACVNCDARASVTQFLGLLHYGQGYAFHPVYELSVGAIGYSNFRREDGDPALRLGSATTDYDFKLGLAYGLGFGLSPTLSVEVVQEIATVIHQKDGLAGSSSSYPRVYVTRLGGKIAF